MFDWMRQTFKALSVCHSERDLKLVGLTQTLEVYLAFRAFKGQTNQTFPFKKKQKTVDADSVANVKCHKNLKCHLEIVLL